MEQNMSLYTSQFNRMDTLVYRRNSETVLLNHSALGGVHYGSYWQRQENFLDFRLIDKEANLTFHRVVGKIFNCSYNNFFTNCVELNFWKYPSPLYRPILSGYNKKILNQILICHDILVKNPASTPEGKGFWLQSMADMIDIEGVNGYLYIYKDMSKVNNFKYIHFENKEEAVVLETYDCIQKALENYGSENIIFRFGIKRGANYEK